MIVIDFVRELFGLDPVEYHTDLREQSEFSPQEKALHQSYDSLAGHVHYSHADNPKGYSDEVLYRNRNQ